MDHHAFGFVTRGQCIKGKQCLHITIMFSKQSSVAFTYLNRIFLFELRAVDPRIGSLFDG